MKNCLLLAIIGFILFVSPVSAAELETLYVSRVSPFVTVSDEGEIRGPAVEIVTHILREAGVPVSHETFQHISWAGALDDVVHHPGYGAFCLVKTRQREDQFAWVGPIGESVLALFARKSRNIVVARHEDIHKYRMGVVRNSAPSEFIEYECLLDECRIYEFKDDTTLFKMLAENRLDLVAYPVSGAWQIIKDHNLDPQEFEEVYRFDGVQLYLALNRDTDPALVERLNDALENLKKEKPGRKSAFDHIYEKYSEKRG